MNTIHDHLTIKQTQFVVQEAVKALIYLHNGPLQTLHLDVKCANILLTEAGDVKLGISNFFTN